jgi:hypothetical protein
MVGARRAHVLQECTHQHVALVSDVTVAWVHHDLWALPQGMTVVRA